MNRFTAVAISAAALAIPFSTTACSNDEQKAGRDLSGLYESSDLNFSAVLGPAQKSFQEIFNRRFDNADGNRSTSDLENATTSFWDSVYEVTQSGILVEKEDGSFEVLLPLRVEEALQAICGNQLTEDECIVLYASRYAAAEKGNVNRPTAISPSTLPPSVNGSQVPNQLDGAQTSQSSVTLQR